MPKGFTLIELALVLALIAIITALATPTYETLVRRARAAEAPVALESIAQAELMHRRNGQAYLACGRPGSFDPGEPCWKSLGVSFDGIPRYAYRVETTDGGFVALAEGDLDGDGVHSLYRMDGRTLSLSVQEPLE